MVNISIDLTETQLEFLKQLYATGQYRSRSEIVRDVIRRAQFEWKWAQAVKEVEQKGVTMSDFENARKDVSKKLLGQLKHVQPKPRR